MFVEGKDGELAFHALPHLANDDVANVLQIARTRILALLRRKGVLADDAVSADAKLGESEPALASLAVASTLGTAPAGPALRRREPVRLRDDRGIGATSGLCAVERGFSLHAATTASASDVAGKEALCRYILRPPIAAERVQIRSRCSAGSPPPCRPRASIPKARHSNPIPEVYAERPDRSRTSRR